MVGFVDTQDNMKNFNQKFAGTDAGPYVGKVKFTNDPLRQGRLGVNIPDLSQTNDPAPDDCIWCQYLSPFYGAKSVEATNKSAPDDYKLTQHSYGMWFVPPDIDTEVLVIFAKGELSKKNAFWIGCVQQPLTNQQVPGYGASTFTELASDRSDARERAITANATGQTQDYGTDLLPVGERNRRLIEGAVSAESANLFRYPVNRILADQMSAQGLIQDPVRGTTTSSAKREAPSQVFGINTPGRIREDSRSLNIGPGGTPVRPDRVPGHSFVMDDGAEDGSNQLTRIRTASGHQILMHDTEGTVYIANGSGKAFIEMEKDGTISVFSDGGINMRTKQDFNLHSDRHVNFHAKGSLNFTAEQNVNLNGGFNVQTMAKNSILNSSQGDLRSYAATQITSFTRGTQMHGAGGNIDLAGAQVHMNSQGARAGWGPSWLVPESDRVGIKVTGGEVTDGDAALIDIDSRKPLQGGKPNKIANKTTVSDFVTHEPYTRTSSTAIRKRYINDIIASIESGNPSVSSQDLENIKKQLLSKDSIDAVSSELNKIVGVTSDRVSEFASTEINKLVGDNTKLNSSQLNNIQQLLVGPSIASVSGEISKIVGKNVNLNSSQLNDIKTKVLANPDVAFISREIKKITGITENVNLDLSQLNNLKTKLQNKPNIADVSGEIRKIVGDNVKLDLSQLNDIKTKLLANPDVAKFTKQVSGYAKDIVGLSEAVTVNLEALNDLKNKAVAYKNDIKNAASGFIQGVVSKYTTQAFNYAKDFIKGFKWSDSRLKEDIRLVGKSPTGINIYSFKYKQSAGTYEGVMAQEVPWARQMTDTGFYMVDYSKVDVEFRRSN
jgi:hypothetical protein